ncbi:hypothetical protein U2F26_14170 [Micromonospora sp. 4G57]|uniref:Uncharacterized protein n=1 Tax=Micromonospora sicca TaxID=2202420 RepID=A0ABU5JAI9_9ACTN|nr:MULTISPECIES: hypothetical protein [unclassified Micromonospora]MDZ5443870.1 hypothetical protein [Micromonospora sp. 4G57]MDZ5489612.1 hypothetical protein [Micromonospora sp. 4G53]
MADTGKLPLADLLALEQLAYVRQRSLGTRNYRAAGALRLQLTPRDLHWSRPSVFDPQVESLRRDLATFERLARRRAPAAGEAWQAVLAGVDRLLADARELAGHRIRPRRG